MAVSNYFNQNRGYYGEQDLLESLVTESIKIHGIDVYYVPRNAPNDDAVFEEDVQPTFTNAYVTEVYLNSAEGFEGEGDFLSKFGVEIRDRVTFTIARRAFRQNIVRHDATLVRPREGDLIFFPQNFKLFEIKFVEHETMFYNLGQLYVFEMQCELFEYSNEVFSTGIDDIDRIEDLFSTDIWKHAILAQDGGYLYSEDGFPILQETYNANERNTSGEDNETIEEEADSIIDWTELDPFTESTDRKY